MTEFWVEVDIIPMKKSMEEILVTAVKPLIDNLRGEIETWHFLREFEPIKKPHIRFRIRTKQASQLNAVRTEIESVLTPLRGNEIEDFYYGVHGKPETDTEKYEGEAKNFGVKGWQVAQKLMEHTGNAVIEMITKTPLERPVDWYAERCIHFFLNQIGYNRYQEASLLHKWSVGNLLIVFGISQKLNEFNLLKEKYYNRFPEDKSS